MLELLRPAFRAKLTRLIVEAWIPVHDPRAQHEVGTGWQPVAADLKRSDRLPDKNPDWRIKTHRLLDHHFRVDEAWEVFDFRGPITQDRVNLSQQPCFNLRMLGQEVPNVGERKGGGIVARAESVDWFRAMGFYEWKRWTGSSGPSISA
jgi:hypothetical protein